MIHYIKNICLYILKILNGETAEYSIFCLFQSCRNFAQWLTTTAMKLYKKCILYICYNKLHWPALCTKYDEKLLFINRTN